MPGFTVEQQTEGVRLYLEVGAEEASKAVGCSRRQIYRWLGRHNVTAKKPDERREETEARHTERRAELRELLLDQAVDMLHRMNEMHVEYREVDGKDEQVVHLMAAPADCKNYAIAAGTLIDKYRLEMGEATTRTHAKIEGGESDMDSELRRTTVEWKQQLQQQNLI